ncbi:MAG: hypothetical protein ACXWLR_08865, partial [Myxococcales bacterium]
MPNPPRTLRSFYSLTAPDALEARHTALLLVDFQREFTDGALPVPDARSAFERASLLLRNRRAPMGLPSACRQWFLPGGLMQHIAIVLYDGFDALDAIGPWEVFRKAGNFGAPLSTSFVARGGATRIQSSDGLPMTEFGSLEPDD